MVKALIAKAVSGSETRRKLIEQSNEHRLRTQQEIREYFGGRPKFGKRKELNGDKHKRL